MEEGEREEEEGLAILCEDMATLLRRLRGEIPKSRVGEPLHGPALQHLYDMLEDVTDFVERLESVTTIMQHLPLLGRLLGKMCEQSWILVDEKCASLLLGILLSLRAKPTITEADIANSDYLEQCMRRRGGRDFDKVREISIEQDRIREQINAFVCEHIYLLKRAGSYAAWPRAPSPHPGPLVAAYGQTLTTALPVATSETHSTTMKGNAGGVATGSRPPVSSGKKSDAAERGAAVGTGLSGPTAGHDPNMYSDVGSVEAGSVRTMTPLSRHTVQKPNRMEKDLPGSEVRGTAGGSQSRCDRGGEGKAIEDSISWGLHFFAELGVAQESVLSSMVEVLEYGKKDVRQRVEQQPPIHKDISNFQEMYEYYSSKSEDYDSVIWSVEEPQSAEMTVHHLARVLTDISSRPLLMGMARSAESLRTASREEQRLWSELAGLVRRFHGNPVAYLAAVDLITHLSVVEVPLRTIRRLLASLMIAVEQNVEGSDGGANYGDRNNGNPPEIEKSSELMRELRATRSLPPLDRESGLRAAQEITWMAQRLLGASCRTWGPSLFSIAAMSAPAWPKEMCQLRDHLAGNAVPGELASIAVRDMWVACASFSPCGTIPYYIDFVRALPEAEAAVRHALFLDCPQLGVEAERSLVSVAQALRTGVTNWCRVRRPPGIPSMSDAYALTFAQLYQETITNGRITFEGVVSALEIRRHDLPDVTFAAQELEHQLQSSNLPPEVSISVCLAVVVAGDMSLYHIAAVACLRWACESVAADTAEERGGELPPASHRVEHVLHSLLDYLDFWLANAVFSFQTSTMTESPQTIPIGTSNFASGRDSILGALSDTILYLYTWWKDHRPGPLRDPAELPHRFVHQMNRLSALHESYKLRPGTVQSLRGGVVPRRPTKKRRVLSITNKET